jgi:arylsulfatase A-like enzyme
VDIVIICIDTLRYDHLSCNGNEWVQTPNLDAFAAEAVVFDNAYVGSFPTIPHRTDVFTGRFGEPLHFWLPLGFDPVTLPAILGRAGWVTYLTCDTPHLINGGHGFDYPFHGWDFVRGNEVDRHIVDDGGPDRGDKYYAKYAWRMPTFSQYVRSNRHRYLEDQWPSPRVFRSARDFIQTNARRKDLFLWVDCFDPHEPWDPPDHYVALYDDPDLDRGSQMMGWEPLDTLSERELRHLQAHYAGEVTMVDVHLGRFLDCLEATGRADDALVVITSDHGTYIGSHGQIEKRGPIYGQVGHQVLMIRGPGLEPGRRSAIVQPADLLPTILDLANLPIPEGRQGRSFASVIGNGTDRARDVAVSGFGIDLSTANDPRKTNLTVQDKRWCLVDRPDASARELYDKLSDRAEEHNVINQHPQEAERLHQSLLGFLGQHDAHPALIRWFETGERGDLTGYRARDPYLTHYTQYFNMLLEDELFGRSN